LKNQKEKSKGTVLFDSNSINYQSKNIIKADESGQKEQP